MGCLIWGIAIVLAAALAAVPAVGPILSLAVLGGAWLLHWQARKSAPPRPQGIVGAAPSELRLHEAPRKPTGPNERKHQAAPPTGVPFEAWHHPVERLEVVGEWYRKGAIRSLFKGIPHSRPEGAVLNLPAALSDDSGNPYDSSAVAVWMNGHHVGYMPRELAAVWSPTVRQLARDGRHLVVPARAWASSARGTMNARVTLHLPPANGLAPANALPAEPHVVLPAGSSIQVTREEDHMDVLTRHIHHGEVPIAATLHAIHEIRPRSSVETVEVRISGERIGILSPTQSANLLPLVKHVEARGLLPVTRATVKGNQLKADVTLRVQKAQEIDPAWLDTLGPPLPPKPRESRPDYEWDDETSTS